MFVLRARRRRGDDEQRARDKKKVTSRLMMGARRCIVRQDLHEFGYP